MVLALLSREEGWISRLHDDLADSIRAVKERLHAPNTPNVKHRELEAHFRAWLIVLAILLMMIALISVVGRSGAV